MDKTDRTLHLVVENRCKHMGAGIGLVFYTQLLVDKLYRFGAKKPGLYTLFTGW